MTRFGVGIGAAVAAATFATSARADAAPLVGLNPAAAAIDLSNDARALQCMTLAIAYEAGYEPVSGMEAVGEVILNRTRRPAFPASICGVVFQGSERRTGCQFTFTCDGAMRRTLPTEVMLRAQAVARRILEGGVPSRVYGATHYHANYVYPYWAPSLVRVAKIGLHVFYREPGAADLSVRYRATGEPDVAALDGAEPLGPSPARSNNEPAQQPSPQSKFAPWGLASN